MTAPDPVTTPTEDRAGMAAALLGEALCPPSHREGWVTAIVGKPMEFGERRVCTLHAIQAQNLAPALASIVAARVEEARAEIAELRKVAISTGRCTVAYLDERQAAARAALASPDTTGCPDCATGGIDHNHCTACGVSVRWGARCDDHPMPASSGAVTQADTTGERCATCGHTGPHDQQRGQCRHPDCGCDAPVYRSPDTTGEATT